MIRYRRFNYLNESDSWSYGKDSLSDYRAHNYVFIDVNEEGREYISDDIICCDIKSLSEDELLQIAKSLGVGCSGVEVLGHQGAVYFDRDGDIVGRLEMI